jgi:hypothetical protein
MNQKVRRPRLIRKSPPSKSRTQRRGLWNRFKSLGYRHKGKIAFLAAIMAAAAAMAMKKSPPRPSIVKPKLKSKSKMRSSDLTSGVQGIVSLWWLDWKKRLGPGVRVRDDQFYENALRELYEEAGMMDEYNEIMNYTPTPHEEALYAAALKEAREGRPWPTPRPTLKTLLSGWRRVFFPPKEEEDDLIS